MKLTGLFLVFVTGGITEKDLYDILGVPKSATNKEIKSAYKKLAYKYHPDKNKDPDAEQMFQEVTYAKQILLDEQKRNLYNRCGHACLDENDNGGGGGGGFNPFDIFNNFFPGGGQEMHQEVPHGDDVIVPLEVTLGELYNGGIISMTRSKLEPVPIGGTRECNCRNEMRTIQQGHGQFTMIQERVCEECENYGFEEEEFEMEIEIDRGLENGQVLIFYGDGEPIVDGEPGDLKVIIRTAPHQRFQRNEDDLYTNMTISLQDALLGFETSLSHLDGREVSVVRTKPTWPGFRLRIRGEGMPNQSTGQFGSLVITFDVQFPKKSFSKSENDLLKNILASSFEPSLYNGFESKPIRTY